MEICISAEKCGGCRYQGVEYEKQLKEKEDAVKKLLEAGGFSPQLVKPIKPCPQEEHYRNKMDYTFGNEMIDGPLQLGMHERKRFMSVVYAGKCHIVPEDFNRILDAALEFCRAKNYSFYHRKRHEGLLRYLILREGVRTGQILVNIVTSEGEFDEEGFVNCIMSTKTDDEICGIIHTVDFGRSDAVNPGEIRVLQSCDYYMERIMDLDFKVSAFSFFQTNVPAAERLYKDAIS
ncbi:MAG: 23S rRNA (uracil(1939)-C(5))-methyltransferase RlmD, partial [Clostridia bacterium]|nr:23S rRNA (uracil(1939)-C(5))-methyltransferase RlmD [Clostridia bacterium]